MAEPRSSYRRGPNNMKITSQLSEVEQGLNDEIEGYLGSPRFEPAVPLTATETYDFIREDMEFRSKMTDQLEREHRLAWSVSSRKQLADQGKQNDEYTIEAMEAFEEIVGAEANGMDARAALSEAIRKDPKRILNPVFMQSIQGFERTMESPEDRQIRENRRYIDLLQSDRGVKDLEAEMTPEAELQRNHMTQSIIRAAGLEAENKEMMAKLQRRDLQLQMADIDNVMGTRQNLRGKVGNDDGTALALLYGSFEEMGLDGLVDPGEAFNVTSVADQRMLSDRFFIGNLEDEEKQELVDALNTLSEPLPAGASYDDVTLAEYGQKKKKARSIVNKYSGRQAVKVQQHEQFKAQEEEKAKRDELLREAKVKKLGSTKTSFNSAVNAVSVIADNYRNKLSNLSDKERKNNPPGMISSIEAIESQILMFINAARAQAGLEPETRLSDFGRDFNSIEQVETEANKKLNDALDLVFKSMAEKKASEPVSEPASEPDSAPEVNTRAKAGKLFESIGK